MGFNSRTRAITMKSRDFQPQLLYLQQYDNSLQYSHQIMTWIAKNVPISVPNDFPIKTNQQANVETGDAKPRRLWERVENQIGLESRKKLEFSSNLANWLKEVGLSPTHLPNCHFLYSLCCTKQICKYYWHHKCWNHVHIQDKSRRCERSQCYIQYTSSQAKWARTAAVWCQEFPDCEPWQFRQKVEIGEAGKKGWSVAATNYSCQSVPKFWRPGLLPTAYCLSIRSSGWWSGCEC